MSPRPERGRAIALGLIGAVAAAVGVVLASDQSFRREVLAAARALGEEIVGD